jgi:tRNA(Ile)-lysidine synthase
MDSFEQWVQSAWSLANWSNITILLGVSGGADSTALLRAIANLRPFNAAGSVVIAHYNHKMRGQAADDDATFVKDLAEQHGMQCIVGEASPENSHCSEEAFRQARYKFLEQAAAEVGARYIVLAHTADDQAETILHNLLRGSGLRGISGMPKTRKMNNATTLMRPMLGISRQQVRDYLTRIAQTFRHDSSNDQPIFTRNKLRLDLIPQLQREYNPQIITQLLTLGEQADQAIEELQRQALQLLNLASHWSNNNACTLNINCLRETSPTILRELMVLIWRTADWPRREMNFTRWNDLVIILLQESDTQRTFPGEIVVEKRANELHFSRMTTA